MSRPAEVTREEVRSRRGRAGYQTVGLFLGPALAILLMLLPEPEGLTTAGWRAAAMGIWMGVWWATEAVPVAVTALMPIALFPVLGITDIRTVTAPFANPTIYLFLGGFLVALAMQRWELHRRIALAVAARFSGTGASIVGGFMVASALVSMWVTNTSTTMMLLPIATSVVGVVKQNVGGPDEVQGRFAKAMLLGIAYAATIGGMATIVGTPPNALLVAFMQENYQQEVGFGQWMLVGVPLSVCLLPICWYLLTHRIYPVRFSTRGAAHEHLERLRAGLGRMSRAEKRVALVATLLGLAWVTRPLLARLPGLGGLSDAGVAMLAALSLFLVPSGDERSRLLEWGDTRRLPWGVLVLFGGGLALAGAVSNTGLAAWMGQRLLGMGLTELTVLVVMAATLIIFLTELTSNLATTATFLPVVAAVAASAGFAPIALTAPVALAASCAFMLPVATPPNAVVFSSGQLTVPDMIRAGFWMNLVGIVLVSVTAVFLAPLVLG